MKTNILLTSKMKDDLSYFNPYAIIHYILILIIKNNIVCNWRLHEFRSKEMPIKENIICYTLPNGRYFK